MATLTMKLATSRMTKFSVGCLLLLLSCGVSDRCVVNASDQTHIDNLSTVWPIVATTGYPGGTSGFIGRVIPPGGSDFDEYNPVDHVDVEVKIEGAANHNSFRLHSDESAQGKDSNDGGVTFYKAWTTCPDCPISTESTGVTIYPDEGSEVFRALNPTPLCRVLGPGGTQGLAHGVVLKNGCSFIIRLVTRIVANPNKYLLRAGDAVALEEDIDLLALWIPARQTPNRCLFYNSTASTLPGIGVPGTICIFEYNDPVVELSCVNIAGVAIFRQLVSG